MRILLRSKLVGAYYAGEGQWTNDRSRAQEFKGGDIAVKEALKHRLIKAEIVYSFENPKNDISVPIRSP